jgi:hypothetical protein
MLNPLANVRFWGQSGHDSNGAVISANDPKRTFAWQGLGPSYFGGVYQMGDV